MTEPLDDEEIDEIYGDSWERSTEICPQDGGSTVVGPWWDDIPENGGQVIGTLHSCTNPDCDWFDRR